MPIFSRPRLRAAFFSTGRRVMNQPNREILWIPITLAGQFDGFDSQSAQLFVSKYPITVEQFDDFINMGGYKKPRYWSPRGRQWRERERITRPKYWMQSGYDLLKQPVTGVSFWEAEAYAKFLGADIPNETEWAWIATNGNITRYPWGDDTDAIQQKRANLSFFGMFRHSELTEVNTFPQGQSEQGVWDLIGNVCEWCIPRSDRQLDCRQMNGVLRGGCSWHTPLAVDSLFRDEVSLDTRDNQTGIRLVMRTDVTRPISVATSSVELTRPSDTSFQIQNTTVGKTDSPRQTVQTIRRPTAPFRQEGIPHNLTADKWRLDITGAVQRPCELSLDELRTRFVCRRRKGMYVCVCRWGQINEVAGVLLEDLVEHVLPTIATERLYVLQRSVAGPKGVVYESSISVAEAIRQHALICYELDGNPLTKELGWPIRLVDFSLYGYKQVKCLQSLYFSTEFSVGWWEKECQYDPCGKIQPGVITLVGDNSQRFEISSTGVVSMDD